MTIMSCLFGRLPLQQQHHHLQKPIFQLEFQRTGLPPRTSPFRFPPHKGCHREQSLRPAVRASERSCLLPCSCQTSATYATSSCNVSIAYSRENRSLNHSLIRDHRIFEMGSERDRKSTRLKTSH